MKVDEGKRQRVETRIAIEGGEGRVIGPRALWTILGTRFGRGGVTPHVAQRIMRGSNQCAVLRHFTVSGLADTAAAVDRLPGITAHQHEVAATGATDAVAAAPTKSPQLVCEQSGHETGRRGAASCGEVKRGADRGQHGGSQNFGAIHMSLRTVPQSGRP